MNTLKTIIASIVASIVVVAVALSVHKTPTPTPVTTVVRGTSPEISSPYLTVNGVSEFYVTQPFAVGTSTICSIPSPLIGSSTIQYISVDVTANTNPNTLKFDIATATTPFATTSVLVSQKQITALLTDKAGWIPATFGGASFSGATTTSVTYNGQYINVTVGTTSGTGANALGYSGFCQAEFTAY